MRLYRAFFSVFNPLLYILNVNLHVRAKTARFHLFFEHFRCLVACSRKPLIWGYGSGEVRIYASLAKCGGYPLPSPYQCNPRQVVITTDKRIQELFVSEMRLFRGFVPEMARDSEICSHRDCQCWVGIPSRPLPCDPPRNDETKIRPKKLYRCT